jgi:hypothetical protein
MLINTVLLRRSIVSLAIQAGTLQIQGVGYEDAEVERIGEYNDVSVLRINGETYYLRLEKI